MPILLSEITQYLEQHSVTNYAALPDPTTVPNELWYSINSQGIRFINYKPNGWYFSDGLSWTWQETAFEASQSEVDAGTATNKFVSPITLKNCVLFQHLDATSSIQNQLNGKASNLIAKINSNIAHTGSTLETILNPSTPISGFQANDFANLKIGIIASNNANSKTLKVYVNTSHSLSGATPIGTYIFTSNSGGVFNFGRQLTFMNSLSSVRVINTSVSHANDEISMPNNADATLTYDFNGINYLIITGTLANALDTLNLKWMKFKRER